MPCKIILFINDGILTLKYIFCLPSIDQEYASLSKAKSAFIKYAMILNTLTN